MVMAELVNGDLTKNGKIPQRTVVNAFTIGRRYVKGYRLPG